MKVFSEDITVDQKGESQKFIQGDSFKDASQLTIKLMNDNYIDRNGPKYDSTFNLNMTNA